MVKFTRLALAVLSGLFAAPAFAEEVPILKIYTYDGFAAEWGPGPQLKAGFEAICGGCIVEWIAADSEPARTVEQACFPAALSLSDSAQSGASRTSREETDGRLRDDVDPGRSQRRPGDPAGSTRGRSQILDPIGRPEGLSTAVVEHPAGIGDSARLACAC